MERENLDLTKLVWIGLIVLATFGLIAAFLKPPFEKVEDDATPGPSPAIASLQCLDGKSYRSVDELTGPETADGFPTRGYWTLKFADGRFMLDQAGVHEAGPYRCDGGVVLGSGSLGSHRGQIEPAGDHLAWDGQGFEAQESSPAPRSATTSG